MPQQHVVDLRDTATQRALVQRIRSGDVEAFALLFDAYWVTLARLAERIVASRPVAEDVVQDVLLKIWRTRDTWGPGTNLTSYLFAMTRNAAINACRRRALESRWHERMEDDEGRTVDYADATLAPDVIAERHIREEALAAAVGGLTALVRETFLLRWRDQLSYPEIAAVLGVPIKTVEKRLGRAFAALRRALRPWISGEP